MHNSGSARRALKLESMSNDLPELATVRAHSVDAVARTLAWLRLCAVAGQAITVAAVVWWLQLDIPVMALLGGIALLALFALFTFWRLSWRAPVTPREVVMHIAVDTLVLGFLLYQTGGASNPFVSLLVVPIALAAAALPLSHVVAVATLAGSAYLGLMIRHLPLPELRNHAAGTHLDLQVLGMALSFVITAALLGIFITRLARALRVREAYIARKRERALRDDGIMAIATQAAGAAHELNTPLSTIRTLVAELRRGDVADETLAEDLALLAGEADRCREILRGIVKSGAEQMAGTAERMGVDRFTSSCLHRFSLLRPEIDVRWTAVDTVGGTIVVEPSLRHALINLLSNAADASLATGSNEVELQSISDQAQIEFRVRDHGPGLALSLAESRTLFQSSKPEGLGLGLALADATAERLGGELVTIAAIDGGLVQCLRLPPSSLARQPAGAAA